MKNDFHEEPFSPETILKLQIIQDYIKEWYPVFLVNKSPITKYINVFDFFAGPGKDCNNNNGTPTIILDKLFPYLKNIEESQLCINLYFNEFKKWKYDSLVETISSRIKKQNSIKCHFFNEDFKIIFNKLKHNFNDAANLIILDQCGIKHIDNIVFQEIVSHKLTDFIFFISSSYIKRFSENSEFMNYIKIDKRELEKTPYFHIHRKVLEFYKSQIDKKRNYFISSFSLKKGSNIYGLIFGSNHVRGIEKFLRVVWKIDPIRGEANYDIDDDNIDDNAPALFEEMNKPLKLNIFEHDLKGHILKCDLRTNHDIYLFSLSNGFLPSQAKKIMMKLYSEKIILNKLSISYDAFKNNPPQNIELNKNI